MDKFIKGKQLCKDFFNECAKPVIDRYFPALKYSAGLIGYGSDVLGYDDEISTDHMWGPRFYMFLSEDDTELKENIFKAFCENLPYTYKGFSVNFTKPDLSDNGVQRPEFIDKGNVNPLIFITTFEEFLEEQLGTADLDNITGYDWLSFSEHRLLSLVRGTFFADGLECAERLSKIKFYPEEVKLYLIASCWDIIASEQAFIKRSAVCEDDIGSRIICARIAERLMRLCFLYKETYAPYSKWFGTAFKKLEINQEIKDAVAEALSGDSCHERENGIVKAQALVANLHNESKVTDLVEYKIENYYGRDIKVIFAEKFAEATKEKLKNTVFETMPLVGNLSQIGALSSFADEKHNWNRISKIYSQL